MDSGVYKDKVRKYFLKKSGMKERFKSLHISGEKKPWGERDWRQKGEYLMKQEYREVERKRH